MVGARPEGNAWADCWQEAGEGSGYEQAGGQIAAEFGFGPNHGLIVDLGQYSLRKRKVLLNDWQCGANNGFNGPRLRLVLLGFERLNGLLVPLVAICRFDCSLGSFGNRTPFSMARYSRTNDGSSRKKPTTAASSRTSIGEVPAKA